VAHAICGHRLCVRGVDDAGRLHLQDGEWSSATCERIVDGMTAIIIIFAMSLGLIVPKLAIDRVSETSTPMKF
jgi:hypothetical protein